MTLQGYDYGAQDFAQLLLAKLYPERTTNESGIIRDYLREHLAEFDRVSFTVRVGVGHTPDPSLPVRIQKQQKFVTQKRIDLLAWRGSQPVIVEAKYLVQPSALGQILGYRQLFLEELPDAPEPDLVVIGRASDPDTLRILQAHGVTVILYPESQSAGADAGGGI
ncbi:MAG TPA: hypothetical protein VJN96_09075 [Vicinamibacterales bacterium]|nr:hypothetical protein [Vicinamibacterales bacterium]